MLRLWSMEIGGQQTFTVDGGVAQRCLFHNLTMGAVLNTSDPATCNVPQFRP